MVPHKDFRFAVVCLAVAVNSSGCGHLSLRRHREQQVGGTPLPRFEEVPPPLSPSATDTSTVAATAGPAVNVVPASPSVSIAPADQPSPRSPSGPVAVAMETGRDSAGGAAVKAAADPRVVFRNFHRGAVEKFAAMDSYIARLRRREQINSKDAAEELVAFRFRKQPWSVHMKWVGPEANGREVIFVKGQYEGKLHTLLAATDPRFPLSGKVVSLSPDSPLVRSRTRYPITEAGIGALIDRFGALVDREESGKTRALRYAGAKKRLEYEEPLEAVEQTLAANEEPPLPQGGRRWWFFEPKSGLPVLVITADPAGREVEYYCYDRIQAGVGLDDDDFNPEKVWKGKK